MFIVEARTAGVLAALGIAAAAALFANDWGSAGELPLSPDARTESTVTTLSARPGPGDRPIRERRQPDQVIAGTVHASRNWTTGPFRDGSAPRQSATPPSVADK